MQKLISGAKRLARQIRYLLPSKLPRGSKEFDQFANSILETYQFPKTESYQHSIAVMLQHLDSRTTMKAKRWFSKALANAEVRECAFFKIREYSEKRKAEDEKNIEAK